MFNIRKISNISWSYISFVFWVN